MPLEPLVRYGRIALRPVDADQLETFLRMYRDAWAEHKGAVGGTWHLCFPSIAPQEVGARVEPYFVEKEGGVIGGVTLLAGKKRLDAQLPAFVMNLFLKKEHRGNELGNEIVQAAMKRAKGLGFKQIEATIELSNSEGINRFRDMGWEEYGEWNTTIADYLAKWGDKLTPEHRAWVLERFEDGGEYKVKKFRFDLEKLEMV